MVWWGGRAGGHVLPCLSSTWESLSGPSPHSTKIRVHVFFTDFPATTSAGVKQLIGSFVHDESIRIYNIHLCLELQSCLLNLIVVFSEPQLRCLNTPTSCFWPRGDDYQQFTVREFPRDPERTTSRNTEHMRALRKQDNRTRRVAPTHQLFNSFSTAAVLRP